MMDVTLIRGRTIYTGTGTVPVELTQGGHVPQDDAHESDSSSSSEDGEADAASRNRKQSKGKKKRKEKRNSGPWKLVVTYKGPAA